MSREKRFPLKRTWWNSLELLVISLFLVQFEGNSSLVAKTLSTDDVKGDRPTDQPSPRHFQPRDPIRLADEPVYIDRLPTPSAPERIEVPIPTADIPIDSGAPASPSLDTPEATIENGAGENEAGNIEATEPSQPDYLADEPIEPSIDRSVDQPIAVERPVSNRWSPAPTPSVVRRSQQELLADYQNKIHVLVVEKSLKTAPENSEVRNEAKAETVNTLEQLNSEQKAALLKFLAESNLIDNNSPIISLVGADLSSADLNRMMLSKLDLRDADLRDAKLSRANLSGTKLFRANLNRADLSFANLSGAELFRASLSNGKLFFANFSSANLDGADLSGSDISLANFSQADLSNADLSQTDLSFTNFSKAELVFASLNNADLSFANLKGANLKGADLSGVNLREADLSNVDLSGANLTGADLSGANLTGANLFGVDLSSTTLSNTTLPDGTRQAQ
jgi:uncharacterized protein YjbI with pentapeptide repeats